MPSFHDLRSRFVEAISWIGAHHYSLLLYTVCPSGSESLYGSVKEYWVDGAEFKFFKLSDDDWPFEVALLEIYVERLDDSLDNNIARTLSTLAWETSSPCVFMFEAVFNDYKDMFSEYYDGKAYGLCLPHGPAMVCTIDRARESGELADYLRLARRWFVERYPEILATD